MSEIDALIQEIEANEKQIAALEKKVAPLQKKQRKCMDDVKTARSAARTCQEELDPLLLEAQNLRFANQALKLKAGNAALKERTATH
jgi:predicted  nucleic acid-binding Zn-ribbon protein